MARKSLKGKWGKIGAPPKDIKYPTTRFTIERAVKLNPTVCELTVRTRIWKDVEAGTLTEAEVIRQPNKSVGRPKYTFIRKDVAQKLKTAKKPTKATSPVTVTSSVTSTVTVPITPVRPAPVNPVTQPTPTV